MTMRAGLTVTALALTISLPSLAHAQAPASKAIPVTVDNFARAESDFYFSATVRNGGFGKFVHRREPASIDKQDVIRMNRDTLYSSAVFDLDAGSVTVTLPETNNRYMSMLVINEDHYAQAFYYAPGTFTLDRKGIWTRYVLTVIRTLVDPSNPNDVKEVHALQDAIKSTQQSVGKFEVPNWDQTNQKKIRDALLVLGAAIPDYKGAFGKKDEVDPIAI